MIAADYAREHDLVGPNNLLLKDRTITQQEGREGLPEGSRASVTFQESFMLLQSVTAQKKNKLFCLISLKVAHEHSRYQLKCCGACFASYILQNTC